jgi:transporter family protein
LSHLTLSWQFWAVLVAVFAARTAIFAKTGVEGITADFATFPRTAVVFVVPGAILFATRQFEPLRKISPRGAVFLVVSGLAMGASWGCYFLALKLGTPSQVARVHKPSVVQVAFFGVIFLDDHLTTGGWIGVALVGSGAAVIAVS